MFDLDYYQHTIFAVDVQWPLLNTPAQLPAIQTLAHRPGLYHVYVGFYKPAAPKG